MPATGSDPAGRGRRGRRGRDTTGPGRLRLPHLTIRLRLTALYGALFLVSGAGLLGITYALVARQVGGGQRFVSSSIGTPGDGPITDTLSGQTGAGQVALEVSGQTQPATELLNQLLGQSAIALAVMAAASIGLGWLVAGRVLRRVQTIALAARAISATSLNERLVLDGPDDEIKELAETFNALLARLEGSFEAQRQFVANASHELRTPLTLERALVEVALADPGASVESLRRACERVLAAGEQQERLIEALLTLARSERGLDRHEPVDLAVLAADVLTSRRPQAEARGLHLEEALGAAPTAGDARLLERLAANLVDNAVRYNVSGGQIRVRTEERAGQAILTVSNSGPAVPVAEVERLFRPFQRGATDRTGHGDGLGLGLSIVRAVAVAHGAQLRARVRPGGGLEVEVSFPSRPDAADPDRARGAGQRSAPTAAARPTAPGVSARAG